ncbi:MAG: hypothetical protein ABEJ76_07280 [Halanaeroarchaeum sp.]
MADVDRGVSTVLGYTINVAVATLLITGLLLAAGSLVESQRQQAVRSELTVIGERLASNVEATDRLVRAADDGRVRVETTLPRRVAGTGYEIRIAIDGSNVTAVLSTDSPAVRVEVPIDNETAIEPTRLTGGSVVVRWTDGAPMEVAHE